MDYTPQLMGEPGAYISDKDGWTELNWEYEAEGGEEFLYIGNFQPNSETDTLPLFDSIPLGHYVNAAYYFIDKVSITGPLLNRDNYSSSRLKAYPNPVSNFLKIDSQNHGFMTLHNALGAKLNDFRIQHGTNSLDLSTLAAGVYYAKFHFKGEENMTRKIIKR
jgi:hypothetical protein